MDKNQVLEQLEGLTKIRTKVIEGDFRVVHSPGDGTLAFRATPRAKPLLVEPESVGNVFRHAGVTDQLSQRLSSATLATVVQESLRSRDDGRFSVLTRDNQIIDLGPPGEYQSVAPERVLTNIEKGMKDAVEYHKILNLPHHTVQLQTIGLEERAVAVDDIVRAGVLVQFSPIGVTAPSIQAFNMRLVCTNGMTTTEVMREFTFGRGGDGGGEDIWKWFRASSREAYRSLDAVVDRYRQLMAEEISAEDRATIINALLASMRANRVTVEAVRAEALRNPPQNSYDVMNLGSWATSHVMEDPAHVVRGQRSLAAFVSEESHARLCPTCNTSVRN